MSGTKCSHRICRWHKMPHTKCRLYRNLCFEVLETSDAWNLEIFWCKTKFINGIKKEQSLNEMRLEQYIAGHQPQAGRGIYKDTADRIKLIVADYGLRPITDYLRGIAHNLSLQIWVFLWPTFRSLSSPNYHEHFVVSVGLAPSYHEQCWLLVVIVFLHLYEQFLSEFNNK